MKVRCETDTWRVLSPDSPTRPRPEKHPSRLRGLRGGRGGPVRPPAFGLFRNVLDVNPRTVGHT